MNAVSVFAYAIALVWSLFFVVSFLRDRRLLRNGVYLVLALVFLAFGLLTTLASVSTAAANVVVFAVLVLVPLLIIGLALFLVGNGVTMVRKEGFRPVNLLSMLAGLGIIGYVVFTLVAARVDWAPLGVFSGAVTGVLFYLSFTFACFLLYSFVYGRIRPKRDVDFVVVLGAGLNGTKVPPLLASRLDRGRKAYDAAVAKGGSPALVTSGGQGPGEELPESHAMADYLVAGGVDRDRVLLEDKSTTTLENLSLSGAIMSDVRPDYRCLVVTNNYHVLRAALLARKARVNGQVIGAPTAWYFWPSATIREFVAILVEHWVLNGIVCLLIVLSAVLPSI
ncbi:YdcF family protein [Umezawaea sp. Da 62-37]|uniref:YdcF family protein n=1 Tax=Umezawaea sp. Da 62-37 TaxID=3075927 RepID=UPI0028F6C60A|nr:YdcF family protein [Umezawaea sp. Da 62-37]WNV88194.1 YdcF family protein [Umezawaea sp. Da 62-37]